MRPSWALGPSLRLRTRVEQAPSLTRRTSLCQLLHCCPHLSHWDRGFSQWCREETRVLRLQTTHPHHRCRHQCGQPVVVHKIVPGTMCRLRRPLHLASQPTRKGRLSSAEPTRSLPKVASLGSARCPVKVDQHRSTAHLQASSCRTSSCSCNASTVRPTCLLEALGTPPIRACTAWCLSISTSTLNTRTTSTSTTSTSTSTSTSTCTCRDHAFGAQGDSDSRVMRVFFESHRSGPASDNCKKRISA
mmetsp:Transcript_79815/g.150780  ORF Transcript_79815/g.150780 Transcript_79815/m.150780 type:complete len:246 (+) Transcript_79815:225-962(+)